MLDAALQNQGFDAKSYTLHKAKKPDCWTQSASSVINQLRLGRDYASEYI